MLGDSDDLVAVIAVLDRLSEELESNRRALEETCERADEVSDGVHLPSGIIGEESMENLRNKVSREKQDCNFLRNSLETSISLASDSVLMLRNISSLQVERELKIRETASKELLSWQNEVQKAAEECSDLKFKDYSIDAMLSQLYGKIQTRISQ